LLAVKEKDVLSQHMRDLRGMNYTSILWCIYFLLMIVLASKMVGGDSDLVLHVCYGRSILEGGLWERDPFLTDAISSPVLHEWLYEVMVAFLDGLCGLGGPLLLSAALLGTLFAMLFHRMRKTGVGFWVAMLYVNLVFIAIKPHLVIRPHLLSWLAAPLLWLLLEDWKEGRRSLQFTVVSGSVVMLFWSNLHGGFILGLMLCGFLLAGEILQTLKRQCKARPLQAVLIVVVLVLVTVINPWGIHLHEHLVSFLINNFIISGTSDFQPPSFAERTLPSLLIIIPFVWLPLMIRWREVSLHECLLVSFLTAAACVSVRNIPFLGILMLPVSARHLQARVSTSSSGFLRAVQRSSARLAKDERGRSGWLWGTVLVLLVMLSINSGFLRISLSGPAVPADALEWVKTHSIFHNKAVFADFLGAGFLLYATPVKRVYLHALNANYPEERLRTWVAVARGEPGWEQRLEGLEWAFLLHGRPQVDTLMASSCWQPVYEDTMAVIFEKTCP
jgi:hypothetical protein